MRLEESFGTVETLPFLTQLFHADMISGLQGKIAEGSSTCWQFILRPSSQIGVQSTLSLPETTTALRTFIFLESSASSLLALLDWQVVPGSPAEKGGLLSGDVIVEFDGQSITTVRQVSRSLLNECRTCRVSQTAELREVLADFQV